MLDKIKKISIFIGLLLLTVVTTTLAGAEHQNYFSWNKLDGNPYDYYMTWDWFVYGFYYSVPFLLFLTCHEFGHYFMARYHKLKSSLPYYLPFWLPAMGIPMIGTFGAVIRLKSLTKTKRQFFDVGIAGPIAGFVVAVIFLVIGFLTLPPAEKITEVHPEYAQLIEEYGEDYHSHLKAHYEEETAREREYYTRGGRDSLLATGQYSDLPDEYPGHSVAFFGTNLLYEGLAYLLVDDKTAAPQGFEIMHYPFLFAGLLSLLFTALNLIPVGQLDGGHILYGLLGYDKFRKVSPYIFLVFLFYAGLGLDFGFIAFGEGASALLLSMVFYVLGLYFLLIKVFFSKKKVILIALGLVCAQLLLKAGFPDIKGYSSWLFYLFLLSRMIGVFHPPSIDETVPLDRKRKIWGVVALVIFVLCFTPYPLEILEF